MYGEKFIEYKIKDNKIIRINEFGNFDYNYLELLQDINDRITDDMVYLADKGIYFNRMEEFDKFEVDSVLKWVEELLKDKDRYEWLDKWIEPLQEAKGFIIHINFHPKWMYD